MGNTKALEGVRILDLSQGLTGSLATMYLGAYGAEVVKIELPSGDKARKWEPTKNGESVFFNYLNSGKKSAVIDYSSEQGRKLLYELLPHYDVICVDLDPKEASDLGVGKEDIESADENIIYASCSAFGSYGPEKDRPSSSLVVQAKGVAMDMTGFEGGEPVHLAPSVAEHYCAAYYAGGIVMALIDRENRGTVQSLDVALLDSIFSCIEAAPAAYSMLGELQRRKGNDDPTCAPYDTFETSDGYVAVGVSTERQWVNFCKAMGYEDFLDDEALMDPAKRLAEYKTDLRPRLADRLIRLTKGEIETKCRSLGVPCGAVLKVDEVTNMPNTIENGYMTTIESNRFGTLRYPSIPFTMSGTPQDEFKDAPKKGEDTEKILKETSVSEDGRQAV